MEAFIARNGLPLTSTALAKRPRSADADSPNKRKKRKKGKEKDVEEEAIANPQADDNDDDDDDRPGDDSTPISTDDFLSAIIAAATATAGDVDHSQGQGGVHNAHVDLPPIPNDFSNESVLRAIQEMGVAGLADFIRVFNESQGADHQPIPPDPAALPFVFNGQIDPTILATMLPPLGQRPVSANRILGKPAPLQPPPVLNPPPNPEDAYLLANKWLSTKKLDELAHTRGLVFKKGKFSTIEEQQLSAAIENFRYSKDMTEDAILELIFSKEKNKDSTFWSEITSAVPLRPIISVYHHVRRKYHPLQKQGKWTPEEDNKLREAAVTMNQSWEKVSLVVGRRAQDCRDRWRNHLSGNDDRRTGKWTKEEEDKLIQIVKDMTVKRGGSLDDEVFWKRVSELMGGSRNRQQCRIKWTDCLSKIVKKDGSNPRWSNQDAYILVHKLDSLNVRDDTEIDWKTLGDEDWNHWSAHALQRRWFTMKKSIKGWEETSFRDIMEILKAKKTNFEVSTTKRKVKKAPSSAETVDS